MSTPTLPAPPLRPPLLRRHTGRVVGGVAVGLAEHLGVSVRLLRIVFVATAIPFGAGFAVYAFLWATMRDERSPAAMLLAAMPPVTLTPAAPVAPVATTVDPAPVDPVGPAAAPAAVTDPATQATTAPTTTSTTTPTTMSTTTTPPAPQASPRSADLSHVKAWLRSGNEPVVVTLLGVGALALAGALWLGSAGLDVHPEVVLPIVAIVIGAIFFWSQLDEADPVGTRRPVRWIWLAVGLCLTGLGLVGLLVGGTDLAELWQVTGAVLAALVGMAVLSAPWVLRLWSNLREEQAARIRAVERADIAAHLHDSVLQTLALIQRQSGDSAMVARLARAQERQLRSYLYDEDARAGSLTAALTAALGEVEDLHGVPVQLVVTGDRPMDHHLDALVKAVREAAWNAVRHAQPPVSAYVEVGPTAVEAFVRDHGAGFELDDVPDDRAGVRESIVGRMERHGGTARIRRRPDGTEIELRLPVVEAQEQETEKDEKETEEQTT